MCYVVCDMWNVDVGCGYGYVICWYVLCGMWYVGMDM
jgi:hypothetical protein